MSRKRKKQKKHVPKPSPASSPYQWVSHGIMGLVAVALVWVGVTIVRSMTSLEIPEPEVIPPIQLVSPNAVAQSKGLELTDAQQRDPLWRGFAWAVQFVDDSEELLLWGKDYLTFYRNIAISSSDADLVRTAKERGKALCQKIGAQFAGRRIHTAEDLKDRATFTLLFHDFEVSTPEGWTKEFFDAAQLFSYEDVMEYKKDETAPLSSDILYEAILIGYDFDKIRELFPTEKNSFYPHIRLSQVYRRCMDYPYYAQSEEDYKRFEQDAYLVTHIIFAFSDYGQFRIAKESFVREDAFLRQTFSAIVQKEQVELLGEYVECFKILGYPDDDPQVVQGRQLITKVQLPDGSWPGKKIPTVAYTAFHPTWTSIDALRHHSFKAQRTITMEKK